MLAAPETFQLILKKLQVFVLRIKKKHVTSCKIICTLSCPKQAALLQITLQMVHIYQVHSFAYICNPIISMLIFNVQDILWIGFLMNHITYSIRNIFLIKTK